MSVEKLDIKHVRQAQKSFTTHLNQVIQNIPDAFALGLYCYLSSLPHDWVVNKIQLQRHFTVGEKKIRSTMAWLNANFLIEYLRERFLDGTFGKSLIVVKDGNDYIKNIVEKEKVTSNVTKNKSRTTEAKITPLVSTEAKNHPVDYPPGGERRTTYINNKNTNKRKRESSRSFCPGTPELIISEDAEIIAAQKNINIMEMCFKFQNYHKSVGTLSYDWKALFVNWIINERINNVSALHPKADQTKKELKSTVKDWMPGNPDYDRVNSVKRPTKK